MNTIHNYSSIHYLVLPQWTYTKHLNSELKSDEVFTVSLSFKLLSIRVAFL